MHQTAQLVVMSHDGVFVKISELYRAEENIAPITKNVLFVDLPFLSLKNQSRRAKVASRGDATSPIPIIISVIYMRIY